MNTTMPNDPYDMLAFCLDISARTAKEEVTAEELIQRAKNLQRLVELEIDRINTIAEALEEMPKKTKTKKKVQ